MLQQVQEFNHFRLATLTDIKYLAPRLRFEDKREILSNSGLPPYEALYFSYKYSKRHYPSQAKQSSAVLEPKSPLITLSVLK